MQRIQIWRYVTNFLPQSSFFFAFKAMSWSKSYFLRHTCSILCALEHESGMRSTYIVFERCLLLASQFVMGNNTMCVVKHHMHWSMADILIASHRNPAALFPITSWLQEVTTHYIVGFRPAAYIYIIYIIYIYYIYIIYIFYLCDKIDGQPCKTNAQFIDWNINSSKQAKHQAMNQAFTKIDIPTSASPKTSNFPNLYVLGG